MSDYHILTASSDGNTLQIVAHFPVADITNEVGVRYRVALIESLGGTQPSRVPFIEESEQTALNAGELYEHSATFYTYPAETLAEKRARLDTLWDSERIKVLQRLSLSLSYWGYNRDVPG